MHHHAVPNSFFIPKTQPMFQLKRQLESMKERFWRKRVSGHQAMLVAMQDPRVYSTTRWRLFLEQCFVPQVFYDIGANDPFSREGQQTIYKPLMSATRFFLFEAMAKHEPALIRSGEAYGIAVLDSEDGIEKTFYETRAYVPGTGDSIYRERTAAYAGDALVSTRHLTQRLDSLVEQRGWPLPDFIKLDTQGSELDILRGAPLCLDHVRGLQIECNLQQYNEGAPLFADVLEFMNLNGFRLYDLAQFHFNQQSELLQVDAIFVRVELLDVRK